MPSPMSDMRTAIGVWQGDRFIPTPPPQTPPATQPQRRDTLINLDPPTHDELFQLRGERGLYNLIVQDYRKLENRPDVTPNFPPTGQLVAAGVKYEPRQMPPSQITVVPAYLCHQPLYFEEKNSERHGWEMGIWQPFISAGTFYKDLAFLPYKMGLDNPFSCVTNVGKCLPGDCVPYILYVTPFTWKGAALEAGTIIGGGALWP